MDPKSTVIIINGSNISNSERNIGDSIKKMESAPISNDILFKDIPISSNEISNNDIYHSKFLNCLDENCDFEIKFMNDESSLLEFNENFF